MPAVTNALQDRHSDCKKWIPDKEEQTILDATDAAIDRMKQITKVLDPFVLTIPQDNSLDDIPIGAEGPIAGRYHHRYKSAAEQWLSNAPFHRSEHESIQYLTFHFHEPGKEMYVLRNSQPSEEPAMNGSGTKTRPGTGAHTSNGAPKKKISLGDYKKKQTGGTTTPESTGLRASDAPAKQPAVKGPIERVKAENDEILAPLEEDVPPVKEPQKAQGDLKRKRGEHGAAQDSQESKTANTRTNGTEPALKKARNAAVVPPKVDKPDTARRKEEPLAKLSFKDEVEDEADLAPDSSPSMPNLLSPLGPPDADSYTMLSPTVPANLAKAVANRSSAPTSALKKDEKLTPMKKSDDATKHRSPIPPKNGFRARSSSPAVRSDMEEKARSKTSAQQAIRHEQSQEEKGTKTTVSGKKPHLPGKSSLIVRFKIKKPQRANVQRILGMRPQPDRSMLPQPAAARSNTSQPASKAPANTTEKRNGDRKELANLKGVAQKVGPVKKDKKPQPEEKRSAAEKRPPPDEGISASAAKRKKVDPPKTEPSTPAQAQTDSPSLPRSAQMHATPGSRRDVLSVAMQREQSQDSNGTHATPPEISNTPGNNAVANRPPSSQPNVRTAMQQRWEEEQKQLQTLGRNLKRASSALTAEKSEDKKKLAAVKSLESVICFVLAFTCHDEANSAASPRRPPPVWSWHSLHGLYQQTEHSCKHYATLSGIAASLGIVYATHVMRLLAKSNEQDAKIPREAAATLDRASRALDDHMPDPDDFERLFPISWSHRTMKKPRTEDILQPDKLGGPYFLPVRVQTAPIYAARAAYAMLQEWVRKEKIGYGLELKLPASGPTNGT